MRREKNRTGRAMLAWLLRVMLFCAALPGAALGAGNAEELAEIRRELPKMMEQARSGDPEKQVVVGLMYAAGVEGKPDYKKALYWYEMAAEHGSEVACYMAFVQYVEGMGTRRNLDKAQKWAQKLVEMDKEEGYLLLGTLYDEGAGSRRHYAKAAQYYAKADAGHSDIGGKYRLGMFYLEGKGVKVDREKGLRYLEEAADSKDNHAAFQLGMMYYEGKGVAQDDKKAFDYFDAATYRRSAGMFHFGQDIFGEAYLPGQEYTKGMGQLMGKDPLVRGKAYYMMGLMAERGRARDRQGVKRDKDTDYAMKCYEDAIAEGYMLAKQRLAVLKAADDE